MRINKLILSLLLFIALVPAVQSAQIADAMQAGDFSQVQRLIREGLDVNEPQIDGATALLWAAQWNDVQSARLLRQSYACRTEH